MTPVISAPVAKDANPDARVQALAAAVEDAIKSGAADRAHLYVAGRGEGAAAVFYAISRLPDVWAAGLAIGGSPQPAIETDRLFTANFTNTPVLWVQPNGESAARQLRSDGLNLEWRSPTGMTNAALTMTHAVSPALNSGGMAEASRTPVTRALRHRVAR